MRVLLILAIGLLFYSYSEAQLPSCEYCGVTEAPANVGSHAVIKPVVSTGERITISGIVYQEDGVTPASGVIMYIYHADYAGKFPGKYKEQGNGKRHGSLRTWIKTGSKGEYSFETIYPGYEVGRNKPAQIYYTLQAPGWPEQWIAPLWFESDDRVMEQNLEDVERKGGYSNIVNLEFNNKGYREGERNIILKRY